MKCSCVCVCVVLSFGLCIGQSPCLTPDANSGDCRTIQECPTLRKIANKPSLTADEADFVKRSACGFLGEIPKVCCPAAKKQPSLPKTCSTPEGYPGECRSIFECDHIVKRLQSPTVSAEDKAYVYSIKCQDATGFHVCCGVPPSPLASSAPQARPVSPTLQYANVCAPAAAAPKQRFCCGVPNPDLILGGKSTRIDQYPWLAIVERRIRGNAPSMVCGGALISGLYVLTAAHCVTGTAGSPSGVRLGEYDISHPGGDCVKIGGKEDCSDDPVVIDIERVIPHPEYDPTSSLQRHDIALLRLSKLAPLTRFIQPICLPTKNVTADPPLRLGLMAAGWGANETHTFSSVKLQVNLPYKTIEECQEAYNNTRRQTRLWRGQLCAGGREGQDTCKGDSGGPLMRIYLPRAVEVVGIVSFGPSPCGRENVPGVYTNVLEYLPWIRDNMRE